MGGSGGVDRRPPTPDQTADPRVNPEAGDLGGQVLQLLLSMTHAHTHAAVLFGTSHIAQVYRRSKHAAGVLPRSCDQTCCACCAT